MVYLDLEGAERKGRALKHVSVAVKLPKRVKYSSSDQFAAQGVNLGSTQK